MRARLACLVVSGICLTLPARAQDETEAVIRLSQLPSERTLAEFLWAHSPDLAPARAKWIAAQADSDKSHLLPNPSLDLGWGTIPIGTTNPPGLATPLASIPNYSVGLSVLLELGKRGHRQQAAHDSAQAAELDVQEALRGQLTELLGHLAELAAAEARIVALTELTTDAAHLTTLERERAHHGDIAELDADKAALEEEKLRVTLQEARSAFGLELLACSRAVGGRCEPFGNKDTAVAFLARALAADRPLEERPDLRSLEAQERAAHATASLARARAIPDPTVRVGYLRDQFVISGNQQNSLAVGLSFPIPIFDHGQTDARAALAQAEAVETVRTRLLAQGERDVILLEAQRRELEERRVRLRDRAVPLARTVVSRLGEAVARGGASITELLLARRSLGELLIDDVNLDLALFRVRLARQRVSGAAPPLPSSGSPSP